MVKFLKVFIIILICSYPLSFRGQIPTDFPIKAATSSPESKLLLRSNLLSWGAGIANVGGEVTLGKRWSLSLDLLFCPWKISDKFSVKTIGILPEGRFWIKSHDKGSFINLHINLAWYNVRYNSYRYQDAGRPLLGAGLGYGYRFHLRKRWFMEFEIGAGMANFRYDRYFNIPNGALKDTRVSTYWGIDKVSLAFVYYLCDL